MNDDELRALIRSAIQKHMGGDAPTPMPTPTIRLKPDAPLLLSFGQYRIERGGGETECLIEPTVQCNHCGFCKCHGH